MKKLGAKYLALAGLIALVGCKKDDNKDNYDACSSTVIDQYNNIDGYSKLYNEQLNTRSFTVLRSYLEKINESCEGMKTSLGGNSCYAMANSTGNKVLVNYSSVQNTCETSAARLNAANALLQQEEDEMINSLNLNSTDLTSFSSVTLKITMPSMFNYRNFSVWNRENKDTCEISVKDYRNFYTGDELIFFLDKTERNRLEFNTKDFKVKMVCSSTLSHRQAIDWKFGSLRLVLQNVGTLLETKR